MDWELAIVTFCLPWLVFLVIRGTFILRNLLICLLASVMWASVTSIIHYVVEPLVTTGWSTIEKVLIIDIVPIVLGLAIVLAFLTLVYPRDLI